MFLKNKNIVFKIRRSKVTDYAALSETILISSVMLNNKTTSFGIRNACNSRWIRLHDDAGIYFHRWVSDFAQFNHCKYHHQGSDSAVV